MKPALSFSPVARVLHWLMAVMILSMLFIGVFMASSLGPSYHRLVSLHRPLGIAILVLALLRLTYRLRHAPPPLPSDLPAVLKLAAKGSHILLYALMIALPLVGWGMLSAGGILFRCGGTGCFCRPSCRITRLSGPGCVLSTQFWPSPCSGWCWPILVRLCSTV